MAPNKAINILIEARDQASKVVIDASKKISDATNSNTKSASNNNRAVETMGSSWLKMSAVAGAVAGVASTVINRALTSMTMLLDNAIKRVDTLNNSNRTFANMGFSADVTKRAIDALDKSIRGLPTSLDEAVRGTTKLSASNNDLLMAQKVYSALNDAIIGFGGSTYMVDNAVTQLSQDLGTGRITAQTWLSLTNSGLTPALAAMARQMGITTKELKKGLSEGTISVDEFQKALVQLDTQGGGGMKSFHKIALDATAGIGSGMANARTAITRGVAAIIQAIGSGNISSAIASVGKSFEGAAKNIASTVKFIERNKDIFTSLAVAIGGATAAIIAFSVAFEIQRTIQAFSVLQYGVTAFLQLEKAGKLATAAQWALNVAMNANPLGLIITAVAAVVAGLGYFFTQTKTGQAIMQSFFKTVQGGYNGIVKWAGDAVRNTVAWFSSMPGAINRSLSSLVNTITTPFRVAFALVFDFFTHFPERVGFALGYVIGSFIKFGTQDVPAFINGIVGWFQLLPAAVGRVAINVWTTFTGWMTKTSNDAQSKARQLVEGVVGFIGSLPARVGSAAIGLWNGAIKGFNDFMNRAKKWASDTVKSIVDQFISLPAKIGKAISGAISSAGKGIGDFVSGLNKGIQNAINGKPQHHALGTNFAPGGWSVVGENGPELLNLPTGSKVMNARDTQKSLSGGGGNIYVTNNNYTQMDYDKSIKQIGFMLRVGAAA